MIRDPDGEHRVGHETGLVAEIDVHDLHFWRMMATGGSVGAGEAYMAELWDTPDLVAAIRVLAASRMRWPTWRRARPDCMPAC